MRETRKPPPRYAPPRRHRNTVRERLYRSNSESMQPILASQGILVKLLERPSLDMVDAEHFLVNRRFGKCGRVEPISPCCGTSENRVLRVKQKCGSGPHPSPCDFAFRVHRPRAGKKVIHHLESVQHLAVGPGPVGGANRSTPKIKRRQHFVPEGLGIGPICEGLDQECGGVPQVCIRIDPAKILGLRLPMCPKYLRSREQIAQTHSIVGKIGGITATHPQHALDLPSQSVRSCTCRSSPGAVAKYPDRKDSCRGKQSKLSENIHVTGH